MSAVINDMAKIDGTALFVKVSDIGKALDDNAKALLKNKFESSLFLSDMKACHAYALLNKWYALATYFIQIINAAVEQEAGNGKG